MNNEFSFRFVPCLKYIIQNATTTELRLLRGKTIECISLIGLAVGPEKFTADASEVMDMLLKTQTGDTEMSDDDPQVLLAYIYLESLLVNFISIVATPY